MSNCCYVVTGAARRGGAAIVRELHSLGHRVILHARHSSSEEAHSLCDQLNHQRTASAELWLTDLGHDFPRPWFADEVAGIVANARFDYPDASDRYGEDGGTRIPCFGGHQY